MELAMGSRSNDYLERKTNWAGNENWSPEIMLFPTSLKELQDYVRWVDENNKKVKVIGAGHSFSDCAATEGVQLDLKYLNKVLSYDAISKKIEVQAGIRLKDLYRYFDENNVALPSIPNIDEITLGGAISNATHGTNLFNGTYSSLVREIKLVTGYGELLYLTYDTKNAKDLQRFEAALASFGSLGIFYSITLQLEESYDIIVQRYSSSLNDIRGEIETLARTYDGVQFMLFPLQDLAFIKTQDKIKRGLQPYTKQSSKSVLAFEVVLWMFKPKRWRLLAKLLQRAFNSKVFLQLLKLSYSSQIVTNWSDGELSHHKSRFFNMEYAIPICRIEEALEKICQTTRNYYQSGVYTRCLPFILRPVGADRLGFLSPTHHRDTCYVDILFQTADASEITFYKQIEKDLLNIEGRVSWSRKFFASSNEILKSYPQHKDFLEVMQELDPKGTFVNKFILRIFALERVSGAVQGQDEDCRAIN